MEGRREKIEILKMGDTREEEEEEEDVCVGMEGRWVRGKNAASKKVCHCCLRKISQMSTFSISYSNQNCVRGASETEKIHSTQMLTWQYMVK